MLDLIDSGFSTIRIYYPTFDGSVDSINMCKAMVITALSLPFDKVIWGVVGHRPQVTVTTATDHSTYVKTQLAPWAQALNDPRLQISVGNEEELAADTASITIANLQSVLKQTMTETSAIYTIGIVDYVTAATFQTDWYNLGLPVGCQLGMNIYYEWSPLGTFRISASSMPVRFGNSAYVAEWNTADGFPDAEHYGEEYAERNWADNLLGRRGVLESILDENVPMCVFGYKASPNNAQPDAFALILADGTPRLAWQSLTGDKFQRTDRAYNDRLYNGSQ